MELKIFDVTHGFCGYLIADNLNVMLFDCGYNETTGFRPSSYLLTHGCTGIEHLIIQNFDQDHIADLPNILAHFPVTMLYRNPSISANDLKILKEQSGPLTTAMSEMIRIHGQYIHQVAEPPIFPNIELQTFYNSYPEFDDTNNLSLVSFIHYDGMGILFPGDLEKKGWEALLDDQIFCSHLKRVNIFIASHHGRSSGYCEAVFDYCSPDIIIISDKEIVYETQKQEYAKHASGLPWNGGPERRYVMTTRCDGMITVRKKVGEGYFVSV